MVDESLPRGWFAPQVGCFLPFFPPKDRSEKITRFLYGFFTNFLLTFTPRLLPCQAGGSLRGLLSPAAARGAVDFAIFNGKEK